MNPLMVGGKVLEPLLTDAQGYVLFSDMMFSIYGAYGEFKITFRCEGAAVESNLIKVESTVKKIKFYV